MSTTQKIIVILGQTASGKSELAVKLAKKFNGEIISADSRQVYKGLDIGSGKVPRDKKIPKSYILNSKFYFYKGIPHHLLDVASPKRTFTVAQYQKLAKKALRDILRRGKLPIICGGTGLYINAVLYDYKLPEVKPQTALRKHLEKKSTEELFEYLKKLDRRRAKDIDKHNRRRLIRAIEICVTTGKQIPLKFSKSSYDALKIGVKKSPEELKRRIKKRLFQRLKLGMIEEVKKLRVNWQRLDNLGLEYRYVSRYLRGLINKKEMIDSILKESWHYAKRQITWFRKDPEGKSFVSYGASKNITWINSPQEAFLIIQDWLGL